MDRPWLERRQVSDTDHPVLKVVVEPTRSILAIMGKFIEDDNN